MGNQLRELAAAGQSIWLDNIRRSMFASGELAEADRRRAARDDLEPDDLRKGDRRRAPTTTSSSRPGRQRARPAEALRGARDPTTSAARATLFAPVYREHERPRRLRLARSLADARARHARHDRARAARLWKAVDRPERDDQDSRHAGVAPGDSALDRGRHQHQRHPAVLGRAIRRPQPTPTSKGSRSAPRPGSRSTTSPRWPASSSRASTRRSTN